MDMLKSKEGLVGEIQALRSKLKGSRDQNSVLSDQLLLLQKECKNLLNSITTYEEANHKLSTQLARLNEKNIQLKKKLKQSIAACSDIKKQAENYISSIQARFYEQMSRFNTFVNNKRDSEEIETSYSLNSLNPPNTFQYDSPALSVSESSMALHDNEDIIMAYTQEIKEKQNEISALNRNFEQKSLDFESAKYNLLETKENYEKKILDKDRMISNLQQEIKILNEELALCSKIHVDESYGRSSEKDLATGRNMDYGAQMESLQYKIAGQSKKFDNYIRTIANLEKQVQLQMIKYSELETSYATLSENLQNAEMERTIASAAAGEAENRVAELESLKMQQARVINEQSYKLNILKHTDEASGNLVKLKEKIESLEKDNQLLLDSITFSQQQAEKIKQEHEVVIAKIQEEMQKKYENLEEIIMRKEDKIKELLTKIQDPEFSIGSEKILVFLVEEFKENSPEILIEKIKEIIMCNSSFQRIYEEIGEENFSLAYTKIKNIIAESKIISNYLENFSIPGKHMSEKLEYLSQLFNDYKSNNISSDFSSFFSGIGSTESFSSTISIPIDTEAKESLTRIIKDYSSNVLSLVTRISNSSQKVNSKLNALALKFQGKSFSEVYNERVLANQIRDYEITTVNECSEIDDDSLSEDLDLKVEMSAKRIKELTEEIKVLKNTCENKEDMIHHLTMKSENLQKDKERKLRECSQLEMRVAELENDIKVNKETYEIADKRKASMITTLEHRISSMKKEYDALKSSIVSEKDELFDHIIRIEQESKSQILW